MALKKISYRIFIAERDLAARLAENFETYSSDKDVRHLFDTARGEEMVIVGGGPTLQQALPWLSEQQGKKRIVAVSTTLKPLMAAGIKPDFVVAIDPQENMIKHFDGELPAGVPLVYVPLVAPSVLNIWDKGPRYCAYMDMPWYRAMSELMPRGILWVDGTVSHVAADLAVKMGATTLDLVGMDMSFPQGMSHAPGAPRAKGLNTHFAKLWMNNGLDELVPTETNLAAYARSFMNYIKAHPEVTAKKIGRRGVVFDGAQWLDVIDENKEAIDHRSPAPSIIGEAIFDAYEQGQRDFSSADLRGLDARGARLAGCCLRWAHLEGANFEGADLRDCEMTESYCQSATFTQAQLSQAKLAYSDCTGAKFDGAWLIDTCLAGANLENCDLRASLMMGSWATCSNMKGSNLTGANTYYAVFVNTNFEGAQLPGAQFNWA